MDHKSRERLRALLAPNVDLPDAQEGRPVVLYGAGQATHAFLALNDMDFDGIVVSDGQPVPPENGFGKPIVHLSQAGSIWKNPFYVVTSTHTTEIFAELDSRGFKEVQDFVPILQIAPSCVLLYFKSQHDLKESIAWMNKRVAYAKLRWFDELYVPGDDWDVLTNLAGLAAILARGGNILEKSEWCLDLKWSEPLGFIGENLYFPTRIGAEILESRQWDSRGFWRVSKGQYPAVFAYHIVFQKGRETNVPLNSAEDVRPDHQAQTKFEAELERLFPNATASVWNLMSYLGSVGFSPPLSEARSAIQARGREDLAQFFQARRDKAVLAGFLIREAAPVDSTDVLARTAAELGWRHVASVELSIEERERLNRDCRGGVWMETPASAVAGGPRWLAVFVADRRYGEEQHTVFEESSIRELKTRARAAHLGATRMNWLHGSDDSFETVEWLLLLGDWHLSVFLHGLNLRSREELVRHSLPHVRLGGF